MMTADKAKFREKLLGHLSQYLCDIQDSDGNGTVKCFIAIFKNIYHSLEGIVNHQKWEDMIDYRSKHRRIKHNKSVWCDTNKIHTAFNKLFKKFQNAIIVVSYRSDGIPPIADLKRILRKSKPVVKEARYGGYKYVLSNNNSEECLLVGLDESGG
jgi:adenine-specific DNA methylase